MSETQIPAKPYFQHVGLEPADGQESQWNRSSQAPGYDAVFRLKSGPFAKFQNGLWHKPHSDYLEAGSVTELCTFPNPNFRPLPIAEWTLVNPGDFAQELVKWTKSADSTWTQQCGEARVELSHHQDRDSGIAPVWRIAQLRDGTLLAPETVHQDFGIALALASYYVEGRQEAEIAKHPADRG